MRINHESRDAVYEAIYSGTNWFKYTAPNGVKIEKHSPSGPFGSQQIKVIIRVPDLGSMEFDGTDMDDINEAADVFHKHANETVSC